MRAKALWWLKRAALGAVVLTFAACGDSDESAKPRTPAADARADQGGAGAAGTSGAGRDGGADVAAAGAGGDDAAATGGSAGSGGGTPTGGSAGSVDGSAPDAADSSVDAGGAARADGGTDAEAGADAAPDTEVDAGALSCIDRDLGSVVGAAPDYTVAAGSPSGATNDLTGPCGGANGPDVAFRWRVPFTGAFLFYTLGSTYDTVLYLLEGDCAGRVLDCNDDTYAQDAFIGADLVAGQNIVIVVDSKAPSAGSFELQIFGFNCPDQDLGSALGSAIATGNTTSGTNVYGAPCGGDLGRERTYRWTAPRAGSFLFDTAGSTLDTVLLALDGRCSGELVACNDNSGGPQSRVTLDLAAGESTVLVVDSATATGGNFVLNAREVSCPDQNLGSALGSSVASGTTAGEENAFVSTCSIADGPEVTYRWTAPRTGVFKFDTAGSPTSTVLYVLEGCGGRQLDCGAAFGSAGASATASLSSGQSVVVVVEGAAPAGGGYVLNVSEVPCPETDLGSALGQSLATGSTAGKPSVLSSSCGGAGVPEATFGWTAPKSATFVFDTAGSTLDTVLSVRDGSCQGQQLTCNDEAGSSTTSRVAVSLAAMQRVVLVVDGYSTTGNFRLNASELICPLSDLGSMTGPAIAVDTSSGRIDALSPSCSASSGPEVSYRWVAPSAGTWSFDTTGSPSRTVLYVLSGCGGTELDCDSGLSGSSGVAVDLAAGQEVIVVVDSTSASGANFVLNATKAQCPKTDLGSAVGQAVATGATSGAGFFSGSCGGESAPEATYRWTAPKTGRFQFDTAGSAIDTVLYLRNGACSGTELACDDDTGTSATSSVMADVTAGQVLVVIVDGYFASGSYQLNIVDLACSDQDIGQALGSGVVRGTNFGKPAQLSGSCGGAAGREAAFRWTAPSSGTFSFDTFGSSYDTVLYLRLGNCNGVELACNDNSVGTMSLVRANLLAGQAVTVVLDAATTATSDYVLNIFKQ